MLRGIHKLWRERERQGVREEEGGGFPGEVVLEVAVIVLMGKLLEPLWGTLEMVVFFAIINIGVALIKLSYQDYFPLSPFPGGFYLSVCSIAHSTPQISSFFYYILYMITFNTELLFEVHIHGECQSGPYFIKARLL